MRCVFSSQTSLTPDVPAAQALSWRAATRFLRSPLRPIADALGCTLYPADCLLCFQPLLRFSSTPICPDCQGRLRPQTAILCQRCGEDLGVASFSTSDPRPPSDRLCQPCRRVPPPFVRALAFGVYEGEMQRLVHLLKYRGMTPLARLLGRRLAETLARVPDLPPALLVVPVPLHRSKRRQRGFNHAEGIARAAAKELRRLKPEQTLMVTPQALRRTRATPTQAGLTPRQRRENLRGAFAIPLPRRVAGMHVLLVDDIYTTGATARAASQVLLSAGAASVWVATVARAQREGVAQWDAHAALGRPPAPAEAALGRRWESDV